MSMRVMFSLCLLIVCLGLAYFTVIGVLNR